MNVGELINQLLVTAIKDEFDTLEVRIQKGDRVIEILTGKAEDAKEEFLQ